MPRQTLLTWVAGAGVALLAGFALFSMISSSDEVRAVTDEKQKQDAGAVEPAVRVEVAAPEQREMTRTLRMPATLEAYEQADLYAKISGYISEVLVDIGSPVKAGDILLAIDVPEMADELEQADADLNARMAAVTQSQAQLETARAEVARCRAEYDLGKITRDRKKKLFEQHAVPQQELDEAQSQLEVTDAKSKIAIAMVASREADLLAAEAAVARARATVARMKTLMEYATLRAPFEGVITERFVHPGAFVRSAAESATTPLLSIARIDKLRLALEIPESDASFVRVGTGVEILVRSCGTEPIHAQITRIARALRPETRTMPVEVDLANEDGILAPGMYAHVTIVLETKAQALMIPSKAIRVRGSELSVMIADDGKARAMPIKIGYDDGIWAEVIRGLSGGEAIIVAASGALSPGAPVHVGSSRTSES